jgi:ComF family protein
MKSAIKQSWRQLANAARGGVQLPGRIGVGDAVKKLAAGAMELVFPGTCVICRTELGNDERPVADVPFCSECFDELELFAGPMCEQCGAPVPAFGIQMSRDEVSRPKKQSDCYRCRGRKLWFDATIAAGAYEGQFRELLLRMKQSDGDSLSLAVGRIIWHRRREQLESLQADVVAPIPLHWRRRLVHRTNSAAVLAEILASRLRVPLAERLLRRRRHTVPQSSLTPPQRWTNVRQAFSLGGGQHLKDAHVVLVDDILTTGATCSEAARVLRKAGAARVTVVVAARAIA